MTRVELHGELVCADEGQAEAVRTHLPRHIELTRAEPGCESFTVIPSHTPMVWVVNEVFRDAAAFRSHQLRVSSSDWWRATVSIERRYRISGV